ncbi:MAG: hypothetical protein IPN34_03380 [Planctomycetes bacterium]|nr:hypothetical protein [Planctomycetota bacterium]
MVPESAVASARDSHSFAQRTIERAIRVLLQTRTRAGHLRCPVHRTEHLGKSAYLLRSAAALAPEEERELALRLARSLRPHPEQPEVFVFGPGASKSRNLANHAIDSASIAAALAAHLARGNDDSEVRSALQRCARSYLVPLAATKRIPAQRAWALWGLAEAAAVLREEPLRDAALRGLEAVLRAVRSDGGIFYDESDQPRGTGSASAFYHSRVVGFAWLAVRALGDEELLPRATLLAAARWLGMLLFADGAKAARPEAKPWYFPGALEDVSAPFDLLLLVPAALRGGDPELARLARARLARHALSFEASGAVHAGHERGEAFQCASFFAAHALLLAEFDEPTWRALDALAEQRMPAPVPASEGAWELRGACDRDAAAKLARWRSPELDALFVLERGSAGSLHGAEAGGVLVAFGRAGAPTRMVQYTRENPPGFRWRGTRKARVDLSELRFALHLLRMPSGTRGVRGGVLARWVRFRSYLRSVRLCRAGWIHASDAVLSAASASGRRLELRWRAVDAHGAEIAGLELRRTIVATKLGIVCRETLTLESGVALRELSFALPHGADRRCGTLRASSISGPRRSSVRYRLVAYPRDA